MLAAEGLGLVLGGLARDDVMPPAVAAVGHRDVLARALEDDHALDARRPGKRPVDVGLQLHDLAAAPAAVGGDDQPWPGSRSPRSLIASLEEIRRR